MLQVLVIVHGISNVFISPALLDQLIIFRHWNNFNFLLIQIVKIVSMSITIIFITGLSRSNCFMLPTAALFTI